MNNTLKSWGNILASILIIGVIFFSGFFVGKSENNLMFTSYVGATAKEVDLSKFIEVWDLLNQKFISASSTQSITDEQKIEGAIKGLVDSLGDPYTVFMDKEQNEDFESSVQGNFQGVGMELGIEDDVLTVIAPLKNTPAERAGIRSGDKVIAIDGVSTKGILIDEAVKKIRGPVNTKVKLEIYRDSSKENLNLELTREVITIPTLEYEIRGDVFVISLYNFSANASSEFRKALKIFSQSGKNKLVLDLRGNPGGYLEASVDMASWFLPQGKVVVKEDFGPKKEAKILRSKGYDIFNDNLKMVILIDEGSASASEILAGALSYHGVAKLVGEKTFGKGSVQEWVKLDDDTSVKITIARWLTPGDISISENGIVPDYTVSIPEDVKNNEKKPFKKGSEDDIQLKEAINILNK